MFIVNMDEWDAYLHPIISSHIVNDTFSVGRFIVTLLQLTMHNYVKGSK